MVIHCDKPLYNYNTKHLILLPTFPNQSGCPACNPNVKIFAEWGASRGCALIVRAAPLMDGPRGASDVRNLSTPHARAS
ncbi:hypothetical protein JTE90_019839 [Oedothorax gibbosus]|uniref:Uncharacterized protein n=1 Tax=Oedothorax gibbosus TaxID=931172 RepID=A0AAV6V583_9ARAC|nr:hypothetical protein JTE90_019839 [Oedothorax gibbosus]